MKKTALIIITLALLSLSACGNAGDSTGRVYSETIDPATNVAATPKDTNPFTKTGGLEKTVTFSGPASKTDYFCLDDCTTCDSDGTITISLLPDGTAKMGFSGDCYRYGQQGCFTDGDKCLFEFAGVYQKQFNKILFVSCSGGDKAESTATFDDKTSEGTADCKANSGEMTETVKWDNVPKLSQ